MLLWAESGVMSVTNLSLAQGCIEHHLSIQSRLHIREADRVVEVVRELNA